MPVVFIEPTGIEVLAEEGDTVMAAANRAGYWWPTICGGEGTCRACFFQVVEGEDQLAPAGSWEQEGLDELGIATMYGPGAIRLACQAEVRGDVRLTKRGVRPATPADEL